MHHTTHHRRFQVSPLSFFQVNTPATELLYEQVRKFCGDIDGNSIIFDICCGTGTIGLCIAKNSPSCKKVVGIDIIEDAIKDAEKNAKTNGVENAYFFAGKAEEMMNKVMQEHLGEVEKVGDVIAIVDPPRAGLHLKVLRALRECKYINKVVYVSCNQNSLVNDNSALTRAKSNNTPGTPFVPVVAQPFDLFPHTPHCELVVLYQRDVDVVQAEEKTAEPELPAVETEGETVVVENGVENAMDDK